MWTAVIQSRECQVFCVSFKKKFYGEGNLPICIPHYFIELLYKSIEGNQYTESDFSVDT